MKKPLVGILGCGPAVLLAAHAAEQLGWSPRIYSKKVKSTIPGSQYLHEPIPGLTSVYPENTVQYVRMGTEEGYARKVYGDPSRPTGWQAYSNVYPSWNLIKMYDILWERYQSRIAEYDASGSLNWMWEQHNVCITTVPAMVTCRLQTEHTFEGTPYWIKPMPVPPMDMGKDIVIYNGLDDDPWYRWSILGERCSLETTVSPADEDGWLEGTKAGTTNCDCNHWLVRAGRWAKWRHGVLLHHAYRDARIAMEEF